MWALTILGAKNRRHVKGGTTAPLTHCVRCATLNPAYDHVSEGFWHLAISVSESSVGSRCLPLHLCRWGGGTCPVNVPWMWHVGLKKKNPRWATGPARQVLHFWGYTLERKRVTECKKRGLWGHLPDYSEMSDHISTCLGCISHISFEHTVNLAGGAR